MLGASRAHLFTLSKRAIRLRKSCSVNSTVAILRISIAMRIPKLHLYVATKLREVGQRSGHARQMAR